MRSWPEDRLAFGGDYNPEQWPRSTWREDMELMLEAGVSFVTLGVFSWSWLEPAKGEYDFAWLDEAMDLLHDNGIAVGGQCREVSLFGHGYRGRESRRHYTGHLQFSLPRVGRAARL